MYIYILYIFIVQKEVFEELCPVSCFSFFPGVCPSLRPEATLTTSQQLSCMQDTGKGETESRIVLGLV